MGVELEGHEYRGITQLQLYEEAVSVLQQSGFEDSSLMERYSGRGMRGTTTPAISVTEDVAGPMVGWALCVAWRNLGGEDVSDYDFFTMMIPSCSDDMGRGRVYY